MKHEICCGARVLRISRLLLAVTLTLTLVACGSGKDEGGTGQPILPPTDPAPSRPSDASPATFDGQTQTASLRTPGGHIITTTDQTYTASPDPVLHTPQYAAREWIVFTHPRLQSFIHTTWNAENHSDYLILGAWADYSASNFGSPLAPIDIGALFDAPEFRHSTPIPLSAGQATYRGTGTGAYKNTATPGTDHALFAASVELNADFQQNLISGCIGCGGFGIVTYPSGIPDVTSLARLNSTMIHLEQGTIRNANSTYAGSRITATTAANSLFSVRNASGTWQGIVSSSENDGGNPRAIGGTVEGQITYDNAATLSFSAAFIGGSE